MSEYSKNIHFVTYIYNSSVEEPPRLNYMEYLADGAAAPPSSAKPKEEKEKETQEDDGKKREDRPPIGVTIR